MKGFHGFGFGAAVLAIVAADGVAAQDRLVEKGQALAAQWCASCHAVGLPEQSSALAGAPSFQSLASEPGFGRARLAAALLAPHPVMPGFPLSSDDIAALEAYMKTLAGPEEGESERTDAGPLEAAPTALARRAGGVASDEPIAAGRAILVRDCSPCHDVEGAGPSPVAAAPAFSTLSTNYPVSYLEEALAEGIMVNHPDVAMPEFTYGPDDIGSIIAYLEAIQIAR